MYNNVSVDSFGRNVPRGRSRSRDRGVFRGGGGGGAGGGGRPREGDFRDRERRFNGGGGYQGEGFRRGGMQNDRWEPRGGGGDRGQKHSPRISSPDSKSIKTRLPPLPPLKTYQYFLSSQTSRIPQEECDSAYLKYQLDYIDKFSKHYFDNHKYEEWFREKFDPSLLQKQQEALKIRAQKESAGISSEFTKDTERLLSRIRLYRPIESNSVDKKSGEEGVSGHHIDGHLDRTLFLSNIPAICTRAVLTTAVTAAISEASLMSIQQAVNPEGELDESIDVPQAAVERISLAQPYWNRRSSQYCFDRVAWVTLVSGSSVQLVLKALRELKIEIPPLTIPGIENGTRPGMKFTLIASIHTPKAHQPLPGFMSSADRIRFDLKRASAMASLLDNDREIPGESRLVNIMDELTANKKDLSESDTLDLTIAYLRRVHLFLYYSGKFLVDEAQLLAVAPSIIVRSSPPVPPDDSTRATGVDVNMDKVESETEVGTDENPNVIDAGDVESFSGKSNSNIALLDKRVAECMQCVKSRLKSSLPGDVMTDDKDVQEITEAQDKAMDEVANENCLIENNRVRCAATDCKKLFKGKEFLKKHILNKHIELALEHLVRISEPYMLARFESKDVTSRHLPSLRIEGRGGHVEEKSVRDVREIAINKGRVPQKQNPPLNRGEKRPHNYDSFEPKVANFKPMPPPFQPPRPVIPPPPIPPPIVEDSRTLHSYKDVDAPVVVSCVESDFGVSLPPPKKKKLVIKKKLVT